jgi:hypothetical protein
MSEEKLRDLSTKVVDNADLRHRLLSDPESILDFEAVAREAGLDAPVLAWTCQDRSWGAMELEAVASGSLRRTRVDVPKIDTVPTRNPKSGRG